MSLELKCRNGENRCQVVKDGEQCNINENHECECHHFGLDSMLYGLFPPSTCTDERHDGSCSTCIVREVRGKEY